MYLEGKQIELKTPDLKKYLNKKVMFLLKRNVDRSGRGYFSPQCGIISEVYRKHIIFENGETVSFGCFQEITEIENQ